MDFNVANRLIQLREVKGLNTTKLAEDAMLSQSFVRDIELGRKIPTVLTLNKLCNALGITLKEFFDDGTIDRITDDPLIKVIYKLNPKQREIINEILKLI